MCQPKFWGCCSELYSSSHLHPSACLILSLFRKNNASIMTIMTRGMQKAADLTSNAELPTVPVNPPALQEGNHLTVASQTPEEPVTSYADPLATVPKDNPCLETASTKLQGPKTKRAKANKVPVDHVATQNLPSSLVVAPGMTSMASSQNYAASQNMESTNKAPPSDQHRTQTIAGKVEDGLIDVSSNEEDPSIEILCNDVRDLASISGDQDNAPISESNQ